MRKVDLLVVAAHPDDAELYVGGTILRTLDRGGSVAICDLTEGEMASRGTVESRRAETEAATSLLGLDPSTDRVNLGLPDGRLDDTDRAVTLLADVIRRYSPDIVVIPSPDRHPDHTAANRIGRRAWYLAGLTNYETPSSDASAHRPRLLLEVDHVHESAPDLVLDISAQYERKIRAIEAYGTQFSLNPDDTSPATLISDPSFATAMTARMRSHGFSIGVEYGEAFRIIGGPVPISDLRDLLVESNRPV